jgi:hypothetical protein
MRAEAIAFAVMLAGCAARQLAAAPSDSAAVATASLELVGVTPLAGEQVSKDSIVVADLSYSVTGFSAGQFLIMAQAETTDPATTTDGSFPSSEYRVLEADSGRVSFSFPIRHVWDEARVKRPLRIWFYVNQLKSLNPRVSRVIGKAGPVEYGTR